MPVCVVCGNNDSNSLWTDEFWKFSRCRTHSTLDGSPFCSGCFRFMPQTQFIELGDDRKLCPDCHGIAITDAQKVKPLVKKVHKYFEKLDLKVDKNIPILLVDRSEMNKAFTTCGPNSHPPGPWVHGLTICTPVVKVVNSITSSSVVGGKVRVKKEAQQLTKTPVTSMLILFGGPEVPVGATLAHEMMHAWFRLRPGRYRKLDQSIEEGICEVLGYMWLESMDSTINDSSYNNQEQAEFVRKLIARSQWIKKYNPEFTAAKQAVDKFGLKATLKYIADTNSLPQ